MEIKMLVVTSTLSVVRVKLGKTKEVVRLDNLGHKPGIIQIKEEDKVPETMIHQNLSDFMISMNELERWKNNEQENLDFWKNCMSWTPGLKKSLGMWERVPTYTVHLGSVMLRVSVPVRAMKNTCFDCGAPLDLYIMSLRSQDETQWRISWLDGLLRSEDILASPGFCPACQIRKCWNQEIAREMGHIDQSTAEGRRKAREERQRLFIQKQQDHLLARNKESAERWRELVRKSQGSTSGNER